MHPAALPVVSKLSGMILLFPFSIPCSPKDITIHDVNLSCPLRILDLNHRRGSSLLCAARRQVRYQDGDIDDDEYGHNKEIAMLELYSQSARDEVLFVHAIVDQEEVDVLIFKGLSSSLSYSTSPDLTRSILPERAVIKTIDRIKGPFDPNNIVYLQKDVPWEDFKTNLLSN
ncbi:hypothetical protein HN51_009224 [Arachis hypogaea]|uniref:DUF7734 domain-containing protein n=2 Tax=Arachis TaxID=3817 RepID=A0A445D0I0_ARAHY|nr:uncharacterized protein LOC107491041 [Arachis duranensis]XP_025697635.1 uncharacterized protein LOC112799845 [Arachis hypogaea]QHO43714.1 uncharacterized protein DS421_5g164990 [Arachis hypogaea]RYR56584.1 hypothetical protein Ahy_A05g022274 [Arachis hypogaea]